MKELERARWRCRRGMLELDIVLQRFMDKHYAELDKMELRQFEALLDLSDHDLWNMIALEKEAGNRSLQPVLRLLQTVLGTTGEQYGRPTQRNSRSGQR